MKARTKTKKARTKHTKKKDASETTAATEDVVEEAPVLEEALPEEEASVSEADAAPHDEDTISPFPLEEVDIDALVAERDAAAEEAASLSDQLLRARAEFDNYRKRVARDNVRMKQLAAGDLIKNLLPIADNLDLALQHVSDPDDSLAQGVGMVLNQFSEALQQAGLEIIAAEGEVFDPNIHEAMLQEESDDVPAGSVLREFQRGYRLGDLVLRPSKVVVSSGSPGDTNASDES
jgi:molecular chaperone GrpE